MIHLHLTKFWFEKIKMGEKTSEYRQNINFYKNLFFGEMNNIKPCIKFYCGYPKIDEYDKIIIKYIEDISIISLNDLPNEEKEFFEKNLILDGDETFLKIDLYDI